LAARDLLVVLLLDLVDQLVADRDVRRDEMLAQAVREIVGVAAEPKPEAEDDEGSQQPEGGDAVGV
jgi:hypothetical protein